MRSTNSRHVFLIISIFASGFIFATLTLKRECIHNKLTNFELLPNEEKFTSNQHNLVSIYNSAETQYSANVLNSSNSLVKTSMKESKLEGRLIRYMPNGIWKVLECQKESSFIQSMINKPVRTLIYVYNLAEDKFISDAILSGGLWEGEHVNKIYSILKMDSGLTFLDIGSNIGIFSLVAASVGNRVIAIDCLHGNVMRLCSSVNDGKLPGHVTVIHNAVSNRRDNFTFGTHNKGNVGGTNIINVKLGSQHSKIINSILLDDLLDIFNLDKVVIKMDVELHEHKVLAGAEKFFQNVFVKYVLLEFVHHRNKPSGKFILDFMHRQNMELMHEGRYDRNNPLKWPETILFRHKAA